MLSGALHAFLVVLCLQGLLCALVAFVAFALFLCVARSRCDVFCVLALFRCDLMSPTLRLVLGIALPWAHVIFSAVLRSVYRLRRALLVSDAAAGQNVLVDVGREPNVFLLLLLVLVAYRTGVSLPLDLDVEDVPQHPTAVALIAAILMGALTLVLVCKLVVIPRRQQRRELSETSLPREGMNRSFIDRLGRRGGFTPITPIDRDVVFDARKRSGATVRPVLTLPSLSEEETHAASGGTLGVARRRVYRREGWLNTSTDTEGSHVAEEFGVPLPRVRQGSPTELEA